MQLINLQCFSDNSSDQGYPERNTSRHFYRKKERNLFFPKVINVSLTGIKKYPDL